MCTFKSFTVACVVTLYRMKYIDIHACLYENYLLQNTLEATKNTCSEKNI